MNKLIIAAVFFLIGLTACQELSESGADARHVSTSQNITFVAAYPLDVTEPSGLSLSKDKQSLWTVSDNDGGIYRIDLQGKSLGHFSTEHKDVEGVTTIDSEHLAFIDERARRIAIARKDGKIIREAAVPIPGSDNKGPEALSYDEDAAEFYIMQEKPGILIKLNSDLEEMARRQLKFAQDYSSISFDSKRKRLWVLSDKSKSIHVLDRDQNLIESFSVDVDQMEGIAVDHERQLIYLISDPRSELYIFAFNAF
ncbi:SdiA-regulated domain-containing protein [Coraliomargarita sinensis]|nr:SdiA-regulated domain-containing protein [Coraliomargarita sinensis]